MKRLIKFRGKTKKGRWLYGDILQLNNSFCIAPHDGNWYDFMPPKSTLGTPSIKYEVIPNTVGQFTGLLDKNGKEIYEGDILQNTPREVQYKVYWSKDMHAWFLEKISYGSKEPLCCLSDNFEVVGSVHDNPELLKGGKQ